MSAEACRLGYLDECPRCRADEYATALVDRQLAAIDATPPMPKPWLPCKRGHDPRVCDCDGEPPDLGDGPDRAGHHYYEGP